MDNNSSAIAKLWVEKSFDIETAKKISLLIPDKQKFLSNLVILLLEACPEFSDTDKELISRIKLIIDNKSMGNIAEVLREEIDPSGFQKRKVVLNLLRIILAGIAQNKNNDQDQELINNYYAGILAGLRIYCLQMKIFELNFQKLFEI
jgi:hypothetical protein